MRQQVRFQLYAERRVGALKRSHPRMFNPSASSCLIKTVTPIRGGMPRSYAPSSCRAILNVQAILIRQDIRRES